MRKYCFKCNKRTRAIYNTIKLADCCEKCEAPFPIIKIESIKFVVGDRVKKKLSYLENSVFVGKCFTIPDKIFTIAEVRIDQKRVKLAENTKAFGKKEKFYQWWDINGFYKIN